MAKGLSKLKSALAKRVPVKVKKVWGKIPAEIRKGAGYGALVPVPGATEAGALAGAAVWGKRKLEKAVRTKTGQPWRMFAAAGMGRYEGADGPVRVSPKLDGVYARATKDGVFSKSGKPLDVPKVKARLRRHFRKHPDGALEGELWRKGEGVERIAGAVKSGGEATRKLRLHLYPDQGPRPWPIGAVRRVAGKTAKDDAGVRKVFKKALKKGHEGVVVRRPDGTRLKLKPEEDAEWPVVEAKGGPRNVMVLRGEDGGSFKVQGKPGVAAKAGDRVQVRYSGTTAKGRPKAAVAVRVRNDNDFSIKMNTNRTGFESPARRLLGADHPLFQPLRKGAGLVELGMSAEEEIARDRRRLKQIGAGVAALGVTSAMILRKGKGGVVIQPTVKVPKVKVPSGKVPSAKGKKMPAASPLPSPAAPVKGKKKVNLEDKRDRLSKARDVAVIAGTGAVGAGALAGGMAARKAAKQVGAAAGYAGSGIARAAQEVKREVTPERVAREGLKLVKKKAKEKAVEYFPTFTKAGRLLKKRVFSTPAQRMGVIDLAVREQLRNVNTDVFANPLRVASGDEKAYIPGAGGTKIQKDLPIAHAQVIRSAVREGQKVAKWGGRGSALAKDVADVVRGKERGRDASGRKKKREWEKSWAKSAAKTAVATAAVLGHVTAKRKSPGYRAGVNKLVRGAKKKANEYIPDAFPQRDLSTPAQQLGVIEFEDEKRFVKVVKDPETGRTRKVRYGQAGKAADGGDRIRPGTAKGDAYCARSLKIEGDWKSDPNSPNRLSREKWNCRGDKSMKKGFSTPAQQLGVIEFAAGKRDEAKAQGAAGALVGAANGAIAGGALPLLGKQGTEWGKLSARVRAAETEVADSMAGGGGWKRKKVKGPFAKKGKFGRGERLARAEHEALKRLKKGMVRGSAKGALAGAALVGSAAYGVGKLASSGGRGQEARGKRKAFETPARAMGVMEFDAIAESAGWDVRDPRGRSARVFAPGSRRRVRREKGWHEKIENERKLWKAAVGTAAVGGGAAGLVLAKGLKKGPAGAAAAALRKLRK